MPSWPHEGPTPKPIEITPIKQGASKITELVEKDEENERITEPESETTPDDQNISVVEQDGELNGSIQRIPVEVNNVDTSTPTNIPIPVLHLNTSPLSSHSSSEELWTPRSLLNDTQERNEKMLSSLSFSHDLLNELRQERGELEKDLRVFSESIPLMSDECVSSLRQRMARRINKIETSFNSFTEGRSKTRREMKSLLDDSKFSLTTQYF